MKSLLTKMEGSKIAVLILTLLFCRLLSAQDVQLKWIGNVPAVKAGVSWGVPFEKGRVSKSQNFALFAGNKKIPLQTWPMAYWPDGSVKWLGLATVTDSQKNFRLAFASHENDSAGITITKTDRLITINTGALTCDINTSGYILINHLKVNGTSVSENGRLVCSLEDRSRLFEQALQYSSFQSEIKEVTIEQSGPVRVVVKVSGKFTSMASDRELFPFTVRLYFYSGLSTVRVVHSFIYDGDQDKDFVKSLGFVFDVPFRESLHNRHIRFSGENDGLWSEPVKPLITRSPFIYKGDKDIPKKQMAGERVVEITPVDSQAYAWFSNLASWNDYKLTQLNANGFQILKRTNGQSSWLRAAEGKRASGTALVGDVSGGITVSLKDFWQSYPTAIEVNDTRTDRAQLTVWLWSKDAEAMDLRHYDVVAHDLDATYEDVQSGLSTPYGIARTSELTLTAFDRLPSKSQTVEIANTGAETPLLTCTPEYFHAVKAFGSWSLPNRSNDTKKWIEDQLDSAFLYYKRAVDEHYWYGFWNYGDVMHTYDETRHVWRYDIGGYAWDNTELAPNNWLWYSFLRTGRADIFRMAEAMTRHTGEVDAYHIGDMKGLGSRHNVSHWGCGSKEVRIGQAAWKRFYYYLTTDDRCGDLMREVLNVDSALIKYEPLRVAQPRDKFPYKSPTRLRWGPDWLALAGNWMTEWERTGNTKYRDKILTGMESLSQLPNNLFTGTKGLGYDPATGKMTCEGDSVNVNNNHLATIMGGYEVLNEMFDMIDYKPFRKTFTDYCRFYSMPESDAARTSKTRNWGNIKFLTPRLTAFAAKELNDEALAERAWNEFISGRRKRLNYNLFEKNNLYGSTVVNVPDVLNPVHENPDISTNGTAQWGLNAIFMLELIGDKTPDEGLASERDDFNAVDKLLWSPLFSDDFSQPWSFNWFLDGEKANVRNTRKSLVFKAGPTAASDADHSVLWTKDSFEGDIRVEFDFVKRDKSAKYVNIVYLFAEGSGADGYDKDISKWSDLRKVPAMKTYFEHMNAYHISFAAFDNDNTDSFDDYIRARRYLPERGLGLNGTELQPGYTRTGLFKTGEKQHITIIRKGNDIFMKIKNAENEKICHWRTDQFPALNSGRIGLRLMGSRISEFGNFQVFELK